MCNCQTLLIISDGLYRGKWEKIFLSCCVQTDTQGYSVVAVMTLQPKISALYDDRMLRIQLYGLHVVIMLTCSCSECS